MEAELSVPRADSTIHAQEFVTHGSCNKRIPHREWRLVVVAYRRHGEEKLPMDLFSPIPWTTVSVVWFWHEIRLRFELGLEHDLNMI